MRKTFLYHDVIVSIFSVAGQHGHVCMVGQRLASRGLCAILSTHAIGWGWTYMGLGKSKDQGKPRVVIITNLSPSLVAPQVVVWALHRCHNEHDGVSYHQRLHCLLNCLFRHRSKKTSTLLVTALCEGNPSVTGGFSSHRASKTEMFPLDDVIMHEDLFVVHLNEKFAKWYQMKPNKKALYIGIKPSR